MYVPSLNFLDIQSSIEIKRRNKDVPSLNFLHLTIEVELPSIDLKVAQFQRALVSIAANPAWL